MAEDVVKKGLVEKAVSEAWKGFKGWWIPLCLLSFAMICTQSWIPNYIIGKFPEIKVFERPVQGFQSLVDSAMGNLGRIDHNEVKEYTDFLFYHFTSKEVVMQIWQLGIKIAIVSMCAVLIVALIHIALIVASKAACGRKENRNAECKHGLKKSPLLYCSYITLSLIKILPWLFFILPGFYLYIKLYFTGFLITEESADPFKSMTESWKMSEGHFWEITLIFLITVVIDVFSVMTVIGFIPGTSVKYTLRASLYREIRKLKGMSLDSALAIQS